MTERFVFLSDLERIAHAKGDGADADVRAAFTRMIEAFKGLPRVDVTHYESGCDCCSGHTEVTESVYGDYVRATDLQEVLTIASGEPG